MSISDDNWQEFLALWLQRHDLNRRQEDRLWRLFKSFVRRAGSYKLIAAQDKDDFLHSFFVNKFVKRAVPSNKREFFTWVNNFAHDQYAAALRQPEAYAASMDENPDLGDWIIQQSALQPHSDNHFIRILDLHNLQYIEVVKAAHDFLASLSPDKEWVRLLLYFNACEEGRPQKIPRDLLAKKHGIASVARKAAILGITRKGAHDKGSTSLEDYHTTMLGGWMKALCPGDLDAEIAPVLLKILCETTLGYMMADEKTGELSLLPLELYDEKSHVIPLATHCITKTGSVWPVGYVAAAMD